MTYEHYEHVCDTNCRKCHTIFSQICLLIYLVIVLLYS